MTYDHSTILTRINKLIVQQIADQRLDRQIEILMELENKLKNHAPNYDHSLFIQHILHMGGGAEVGEQKAV